MKYLKTGSNYAPSASAVAMASHTVRFYRLIPACAYLNGEYGLNDVMWVPVILNKNGVNKVVEINLREESKTALHESANAV